MSPHQTSFDLDGPREGASHEGASDTERAAALAVAPRTGTWRRKVLDAITAAGEDGMTDWELHQQLGGMLYTVAPRRNELLNAGFIRDSGARRRTNSRNSAIVWVLAARGGTDGEG